MYCVHSRGCGAPSQHGLRRKCCLALRGQRAPLAVVLLVGVHIKDFLPCALRQRDQRSVASPRSYNYSTIVHRGTGRGLWCITCPRACTLPSQHGSSDARRLVACCTVLICICAFRVALGCAALCIARRTTHFDRARAAAPGRRVRARSLCLAFSLFGDCVSLAAVPRVRLALASA